MKLYLDEKGNIIEKPETLVEILKVEAPELHDKFEKMVAWKQNMNAYRFFLYSFPSDKEIELPEKRGPDWENYIAAINNQAGLKEAMPTIELLRDEKRDITGDKAVVVHSDRPFYDTLLTKGKKIGSAEGWVGKIESRDLTDIENAKFYSYDGKIYQKIVLTNARKLSKKELIDWASANLMFALHHHNTEGAIACVEKLEKSKLGKERVVVYDKYPNIDYCILKHVLKEDEKQVAHISYEEARFIDLAPVYGKKQLDESELVMFRYFPKDNRKYTECDAAWTTQFVGEDSRKVSEIHAQIKDALESRIKELLERNENLKRGNIYIAKRVKNFITPEQRQKADNSSEQTKWYKKFITEQGLAITNQTLVGVNSWEEHQIEDETSKELQGILEKLLQPQGYKKIKMHLSYGWCNDHGTHLRADTDFEFAHDLELYAGELMILNRFLFESREHMEEMRRDRKLRLDRGLRF